MAIHISGKSVLTGLVKVYRKVTDIFLQTENGEILQAESGFNLEVEVNPDNPPPKDNPEPPAP